MQFVFTVVTLQLLKKTNWIPFYVKCTDIVLLTNILHWVYFVRYRLPLFNKMCSDIHCINSLLPCNKTNAYGFRDRKHHFELHLWHFSFFWNSFVMRCVHNYNCLLLSLLSCLVFGIGFSMLSLVNFFFIFYIFLDFISMSLVLVLVE